MQNSIALGAIMGKLNIPIPSLPEHVRPEIPTPFLMPANKTKGEIKARLAQSRRASELDIFINKVKVMIHEDTLMLTELRNAQVDAFPEAYLQPSKDNLDNAEANLPKTQINKDDLDDDEQKKYDQILLAQIQVNPFQNLLSELNWKSELTEDRKLSELKPSGLTSELKVPILKVSEYPVWSVKMAMFLETTDPEYLDIIYDGPHKPTKLSVAVGNEPQKMIPKEKRELTTVDISSLGKDAKLRHLLHSALDNVMSNRVIGCKTAKEIWDVLEVRCQETNAIKKNRKTILTQEYEHFDSKSDESLTDTYDRFTKMLNDLTLVDKEYDPEDSNLKFLLALPEKWDLKATIIRDNYELD
ncbi:hypothetical protein AgCh_013485 [Apium graveolens]